MGTDTKVLPTRHVPPPAGANPTAGLDITEAAFDTVFTGWKRPAQIIWPDEGRLLDVEAEPPLNFQVLYTPPGEPFFCAEPVSNITDTFNGPARATVAAWCLRPGEPGRRLSASCRPLRFLAAEEALHTRAQSPNALSI
ncbi:aldose 1-epimerase [Mesorhizobium shonense]|uniref:Aldose 1-epimerase n=1 Tax=Mesorhizobium shonense TaxID=1209948 RepID=A0ABV2HY59_9HYPH